MDELQDDLPPRDSLPVMPGLEELLGLHGQDFIRCAYRRLLVREPDGPGLEAYLGFLRGGMPRIQVLFGLASSREGRELGIRPAGFARAFAVYRCSRLPLVGRLVVLLAGVEGWSATETRLRVVEELLHTADDAAAGPRSR